jgi:pimeloyl-ACP methyl ester carboxylesterase
MFHPRRRRLLSAALLAAALFFHPALARSTPPSAHDDFFGADEPVSAPTIVLESGLGDGADVWRNLVGRLPADARAFSYDRPGYGRTPAAATDRDPCTIAGELHDRLLQAGRRPPYVLVGHSLGGQYAYAFSRLYPQETAGLVLVDATPPGHWQAMQREAPGLARLLNTMKAVSFSNTMRREFDAQDRCLDRLPVTPLPFPVHVLVKTRADPLGGRLLEQIDWRLAQGWLRLTGAPALEPVPRSGHYIQRDQPGVLAALIQRMVDAPDTGALPEP